MAHVPSCPLRLFRGQELEEGYIPDVEELWVKTSRDVRLYTVPGNHLTILKEPAVTEVVQQLRECMEDILIKQSLS